MADHIDNFSSSVAGTPAVTASATGSNAVHAVGKSAGDSAVYAEHADQGIGVFGRGGPTGGEGVFGQTASSFSGIYGKNTSGGNGVTGESASGPGVYGLSNSQANPAIGILASSGVLGENNQPFGEGVRGVAKGSRGVGVLGVADDQNGVGVIGSSSSGVGVKGSSSQGYGISGTGGNVGVYAHNSALNPTGGTQNDAYLAAPGFAGDFHGDVSVQGKATVTVLEITGGGDLAEPFSVEDSTIVEPGTVMVIDENHPGSLKIADSAYDRKVAGIVSGANGISTGLTLQHASLSGGKTLVALTGRVFCKAEALSSPIQPGDLLTTSSLQGHAMKAVSGSSSWGAIIGKAMTGLLEGTGLILVLVNLQ